MFGLIHECARQLIVSNFGEEMWKQILDRAGFEMGKENNTNFHYSDDETCAIIDSACALTKMSKDQLWETFGTFFVKFAMDLGWEKMFRCMSPDLKGFLNNLDSLHYFIDHVVYKANLRGPSFRCEDGADNTFILHYLSSRSGLYPIVKGVVREVARVLYNQETTMTITGRTQRSVQLASGERVEEHVTFRIKLQAASLDPKHKLPHLTIPVALDPMAGGAPADSARDQWHLKILTNDFSNILPYHIIMDRDCRLVSCGIAIAVTNWQNAALARKNHVGADLLQPGTPIIRMFEICRPQIPLDYENICNFINGVFILQARTSPLSVQRSSQHSSGDSGQNRLSTLKDQQTCHLKLKGQMVLLDSNNEIIYICSPYVTNVGELLQYDLRLSAIPIHDNTRDLVLLNQQRLSDVETNQQLENNNDQLEKLAKGLDEEQQRADELLREVLPQPVIEQLMSGHVVEPHEFEEASVMFTDIPTLQTVVPNCNPADVVKLLNDIFFKFDNLILSQECYKVKTMGEACMTVAGMPDYVENHCERLCHVALGMIWEGREVRDPVKQNPLFIRCGIHSGKVIGGVVGQKMPTYCVFGEAVATAAQMEVYAPPGRIQCTSGSVELAQRTGRFEFAPRGVIHIKGKGLFETFYLLKSNKKSVWDIIQRPRDENLHSIDGYAEMFDGIEEHANAITDEHPTSRGCTIV